MKEKQDEFLSISHDKKKLDQSDTSAINDLPDEIQQVRLETGALESIDLDKDDLLKELNRIVEAMVDQGVCLTVAECGAAIKFHHLHRSLVGENTSSRKICVLLISLNQYLDTLSLDKNILCVLKTDESLLAKLQARNKPMESKSGIKELGKEIERFFQTGESNQKWKSVNQCISSLKINISYEVFIKTLNGDESVPLEIYLAILKAFKKADAPLNLELITKLKQRLDFLIAFGRERNLWHSNNTCREKIGARFSVPYFNQIARGSVTTEAPMLTLIQQIEAYLLENGVYEEEIGIPSPVINEKSIIPELDEQKQEVVVSREKEKQIANLYQIGINLKRWKDQEEWFKKINSEITIEQYQYEQFRKSLEFPSLQDSIIDKTSEALSSSGETSSSAVIQDLKEAVSSAIKEALPTSDSSEVLREILDKVEFIRECLNPMISMPVETVDIPENEKKEKAVLFLSKIKELSEALEFFKNGTPNDREILRSTISIKVLTDVGRLLSAIGTEEQFSHWKTFNTYIFKI